jgi:hypothetical protein
VVDGQSPPASGFGGGAGLGLGGLPQPSTSGAAASEVMYRRLRRPLSGSGARAANSVMIPAIRTCAMTGRPGWRTSW